MEKWDLKISQNLKASFEVEVTDERATWSKAWLWETYWRALEALFLSSNK